MAEALGIVSTVAAVSQLAHGAWGLSQSLRRLHSDFRERTRLAGYLANKFDLFGSTVESILRQLESYEHDHPDSKVLQYLTASKTFKVLNRNASFIKEKISEASQVVEKLRQKSPIPAAIIWSMRKHRIDDVDREMSSFSNILNLILATTSFEKLCNQLAHIKNELERAKKTSQDTRTIDDLEAENKRLKSMIRNQRQLIDRLLESQAYYQSPQPGLFVNDSVIELSKSMAKRGVIPAVPEAKQSRSQQGSKQPPAGNSRRKVSEARHVEKATQKKRDSHLPRSRRASPHGRRNNTEDDNGNQPSKAVSRAPSRAPSRTPSRSHSRSRHRTSPPLEDRRDHSPKAPSHDPVRRDSPSRQHQPNYPGPTTQLAPVDSNPTTQPVESPLKSDLTQQPAQPHTDSTPTVSIHQLDLDNLKATTGFILKPNTTTDADQPPSSLTARIAPSLPVNLISSELTMELGLQVTDYDGDREDQGVGVRFNDGNLEYSLGKTTLRWRAGDAQSSEDGDKSTVVMLECEVFDRNGLGLVLGVDVVDEKKGS